MTNTEQFQIAYDDLDELISALKEIKAIKGGKIIEENHIAAIIIKKL
jgi:hypothetical protein